MKWSSKDVNEMKFEKCIFGRIEARICKQIIDKYVDEIWKKTKHLMK